MRLATYRAADGSSRVAAVVGADGNEQVIDLADATGGRVPTGDLLALLEAGPAVLDAARSAAAAKGEGRPLAEVDLLAPMARPPKILAAAGNYQAHIEEGGGQRVDKSVIVPKLFIKPWTTIIGPGAPVPLPTVSSTLDWELELAVVIGRRCRNIPVERALEYVAGYSVFNDISARTMEWGVEDRQTNEWAGFFDWLNGKWGDGFGPMGPWLVTADEIGDPQDLRLKLSVNGKVFQDAHTSDMIFSCAEMIAFASRFMTLLPGDTFATGTPAGTGDASGTYLREGDVMEGWIERIGTLVTPVGAPAVGPG